MRRALAFTPQPPTPGLSVEIGERLASCDEAPSGQVVGIRILDTWNRVVGRGELTAYDDGETVMCHTKSLTVPLFAEGEVARVEYDFPARFQGVVGHHDIPGAGHARAGLNIVLHFPYATWIMTNRSAMAAQGRDVNGRKLVNT